MGKIRNDLTNQSYMAMCVYVCVNKKFDFCLQ